MTASITTIAATPLRDDERDAVRSLTVAAGQEDFVADNDESIEEADENAACVPLALRADGEIVGFAMYALDADDDNYWIYRLMIDARQQGRGFGRAALRAVVDEIVAQPGCTRVILGVHPDNLRAAALYRSFGFRETGDIINDEVVMRYDPPAA